MVKHTIKQFIIYATVALVATFVDFSLVYTLTEFVFNDYIIPIIIAYIVASVVNYILQKFITFKCNDIQYVKQFAYFTIIGLVGMLINLGVVHLLVTQLGIWYMTGKVVATVIAAFWSFTGNKLLTFKPSS